MQRGTILTKLQSPSILFVLVLIVAVCGYVAFSEYLTTCCAGNSFDLLDYEVFRSGLDLWRAGENPYRKVLLGEAFLYPPSALLWIQILKWIESISRSALFGAFIVAHFAVVLISLALLGRKFSLRGYQLYLLLAVAACYAPLYDSLRLGQSNFIVFFAIVVVYLFERTSPFMTGAMIALGGMSKITPFALLAYLVAGANKRACQGLAVVSALILALSVWCFGTEVWVQFFQFLPHLTQQLPIEPVSSVIGISWSFGALAHRIFPELSREALPIIQRASTLILLVVVVRAAVRARVTGDFQPFLIILNIAILLWSPVIWYHHFLIILPALFTFSFHYRRDLAAQLLSALTLLALQVEVAPSIISFTQGAVTPTLLLLITSYCLTSRNQGTA